MKETNKESQYYIKVIKAELTESKIEIERMKQDMYKYKNNNNDDKYVAEKTEVKSI